jgi:hypothetical protein
LCVKEWKLKKEKEQNDIPASQEPKLTVKAIVEKMQLLDREVKYLWNKLTIWKPKDKPKDDKVNKGKLFLILIEIDRLYIFLGDLLVHIAIFCCYLL